MPTPPGQIGMARRSWVVGNKEEGKYQIFFVDVCGYIPLICGRFFVSISNRVLLFFFFSDVHMMVLPRERVDMR